MPSVAKSKNWYIRVTGSHEFIRQKLPELQATIGYSGMFVGLHKPDNNDDNEHCHIALKLSLELQKQSLDTRIKKIFGVSGANYSSKVWDGDNRALSYMYHEEKAEIINKLGLSDAEISELKRTNEIVQKQVELAKEKASHKILDYALSKCDVSMSRYEIGEVILTAVMDGLFHHPGTFRLNTYILEVELLLYKDAPKKDKSKIIQSQLALLKLS